MNNTVIKVDRLGKRYSLGQVHTNLLSERLGNSLRSLVQKARGRNLSPLTFNLSQEKDFWALKDVSFEVKQGEVVGIIGRNGAGKSTLLKILSRITEPTEGYVDIYGRVGSLLEVGTGFHSELTGRENIYLNGAILGMKKAEINQKFDEIVAFAEVEKFIDTPVKHYSTGMYLRLAFAVAAHLEPEILLVDEVLAVGDAQFQKKCLGKMGDVAKEGRTVLFVSHNMGAINQLCEQSILLKNGKFMLMGSSNNVTAQYLSENVLNEAIFKTNESAKIIYFNEIALINHKNEISSDLDALQPFTIRLNYTVTQALDDIEMAVRIKTYDGFSVFTTVYSDCTKPLKMNKMPGKYITGVQIPGSFLMPGKYTISPAIFTFGKEVYDTYPDLLQFNIYDTGTKIAKYNQYREIGLVLVHIPWQDEEMIN